MGELNLETGLDGAATRAVESVRAAIEEEDFGGDAGAKKGELSDFGRRFVAWRIGECAKGFGGVVVTTIVLVPV
jgi:hypothetical protein